uniref:Uncharacterized protein n=1 Tax=Cacopsylla melanoneura TaxID=428564 RepID=A0A8D8YZX3_9HEMI
MAIEFIISQRKYFPVFNYIGFYYLKKNRVQISVSVKSGIHFAQSRYVQTITYISMVIIITINTKYYDTFHKQIEDQSCDALLKTTENQEDNRLRCRRSKTDEQF